MTNRLPKVLYITWPPERYPENNVEPCVTRFQRGLESFFDVIRIDRAADFAELCNRYCPDLIVVEDGAEAGPCLRPEIKNKDAHPEIPRVGLLTCDPFSPARPVFLAEMAEWRINTFFVFSILTGVYTPTVRGQLFYWPQFVDDSLFRDYQAKKVVPILLTGKVALGGLDYRWRRDVFQRFTDSGLPVMNVPHPGYAADESKYRVFGEHYAQLINASQIAPTCGSVTHGLVMKHLEIPAAKCCLMTEDTPAVREFGFIDMENCVIATPADAVSKARFLLHNSNELKRITQNGFNLVHQNHTMLQRSQLRDWLELSRELRRGQRIVQTGLLSPLRIVDTQSDERSFHLEPAGPVSGAIRSARSALESGQSTRARSESRKAQSFIPWFPEPEFIQAVVHLNRRKNRKAIQLLASLLKRNLLDAGARRPDPFEWGYFLVALAVLRRKDVSHYDRLFATLSHPELDEIRNQLYLDGYKHGGQFKTPSIHSAWIGDTDTQRRDRIRKLLRLHGVTGTIVDVESTDTSPEDARRHLACYLEEQSNRNSRRRSRFRAVRRFLDHAVSKSVDVFQRVQTLVRY